MTWIEGDESNEQGRHFHSYTPSPTSTSSPVSIVLRGVSRYYRLLLQEHEGEENGVPGGAGGGMSAGGAMKEHRTYVPHPLMRLLIRSPRRRFDPSATAAAATARRNGGRWLWCTQFNEMLLSQVVHFSLVHIIGCDV